ncbi:MAG: hybrid sensor histidine kinase/response regulator [Anaerolineae bacterium]|nr:hybrid sensor histidine kinase/response regulator [Anaerolineae bacterium]
MVYREFALDRELPVYQVDWSHELGQLRRSTLDTVGCSLTVAGYVWTVAQWMLMHPRFSWSALVLPLGIGTLGLLTLLVRRPASLRTTVFVLGMVTVGAAALLVQRSPYAPFIPVAAVGVASLVASSAAAFVSAALATAVLGLATWLLPGLWPSSIVSAAVALYWAMAAVAWLTSRDLYTVLTWALHGYETSWRTMRQLQSQRGKLNQTMKALAVANSLLKRTAFDLAEAREEAEQARALKSQFAANISHELRTPLHIIVGFSQMMCTSPDSYRGVVWTPELRGDIQEVYDNASHLLRLIDDVLDLSRIEAVRLPVAKERVDLLSLIHDAVETASGLLRGCKVALKLELPESLPPLYADPTRIRQVLINLLNNAARFTDQGSITIRAELKREDVEVVVEDTGVGIPPDQVHSVFAEFHQVDGSLRRRHDGTGLGLAICKHFVTLHGGRIWVESEVGRGSAFHFTLPLPGKQVVPIQAAELPAGWRYPAGRPESSRRLVTLAEPAEFARLLGRYLPDAEVLAVPDVSDAEATARRAQADAVVLADGAQDGTAAKELAAATADLGLPVITCSLPLERDQAVAAGFSHCLTKPFTAEDLSRVVAGAAPRATKVLVVDDDAGVVRLAERCLRALLPGAKVLKAYDGDRAVELLEERPDLVLLDLVLPGRSGLEVLACLRTTPGMGGTPVVAITAHGFAADAAAPTEGVITIRRGRQFAAGEVTRWLETALKTFPARHLLPAEPAPEPAPAHSG